MRRDRGSLRGRAYFLRCSGQGSLPETTKATLREYFPQAKCNNLLLIICYCHFLPAIVIGLFYLCWMPFFVDIILEICQQEALSYFFTAVMSCIVYSNSAINPLVYGFLNQEFKNTYKRLIKGIFQIPRPRCLSDDATVTQVTVIKRLSEKSTCTVTAKIPATQLETVSRNFHPVSRRNSAS